MSNEVVKYNNDLNSLSFRTFNEIEISLFFAICSRIGGKSTEEVVLDFDYLKTITKEKNHIGAEKYGKILAGISKKLLSLNFTYITDHSIKGSVLFPTFEVDWKDKTLKLKVSDDFVYLFNELSKEFTRFELDEFVRAKGKYSKLLYRLLKQYRMTGKYIVFMNSTEDKIGFRDLMDLPETYKTKDITRRIIEPSIEELRRFQNFSDLRYQYIFKGRKVDKIEFTWTPEERYTPDIKPTNHQRYYNSYQKVGVPDYMRETYDNEDKAPASQETIDMIKRKQEALRDEQDNSDNNEL